MKIFISHTSKNQESRATKRRGESQRAERNIEFLVTEKGIIITVATLCVKIARARMSFIRRAQQRRGFAFKARRRDTSRIYAEYVVARE